METLTLVLQSLWFWAFSGVIPSFLGSGLVFISTSEKMSRKEVVQYTAWGLVPFLGNVYGLFVLGFGLYAVIYLDHKDWWNYSE